MCTRTHTHTLTARLSRSSARDVMTLTRAIIKTIVTKGEKNAPLPTAAESLSSAMTRAKTHTNTNTIRQSAKTPVAVVLRI